MSVSIVIRCLNEEQHIGKLLDSIFIQTIENPEVIVVDSGSTDNSLSIISRYPVTLLSIEPRNFSFGKSLNIGCNASTKEFILIASAHVLPTNSKWIENLIKPFSDPKVALTYGKQRGDEYTKFSEHQVLSKWFPEQSNSTQENPFCNNANSSIRKNLWESIPYNEDLTGLEDIDWAKRAISIGHTIQYCPQAEVVHSHNESTSQIYNRYRREAIALKNIFPEENFNFYDFIKLTLSNIINDLQIAIHQKVISKNLVSILVFRTLQFWGTFRGFSKYSNVNSDLKKKLYYPNTKNYGK